MDVEEGPEGGEDALGEAGCDADGASGEAVEWGVARGEAGLQAVQAVLLSSDDEVEGLMATCLADRLARRRAPAARPVPSTPPAAAGASALAAARGTVACGAAARHVLPPSASRSQGRQKVRRLRAVSPAAVRRRAGAENRQPRNQPPLPPLHSPKPTVATAAPAAATVVAGGAALAEASRPGAACCGLPLLTTHEVLLLA